MTPAVRSVALVVPPYIVVSGYPPVVAALVTRLDGSPFAAVSSGHPILAHVAQTWGVIPVTPRRFHRCGACRVIQRADRLGPNALGWRGYCAACVAPLLRTCRARHGRLPDAGEAYCPRCREIVTTTAWFTGRHFEGKTRISCMACERAAAVRRMRRVRAAHVARAVRLHRRD